MSGFRFHIPHFFDSILYFGHLKALRCQTFLYKLTVIGVDIARPFFRPDPC